MFYVFLFVAAIVYVYVIWRLIESIWDRSDRRKQRKQAERFRREFE